MDKISEEYKKLGLVIEQASPQFNPVDYAKKFEKCSILKASKVEYSSSTSNTVSDRDLTYDKES